MNYLLYGNDSYLLKRKLDEIFKQHISDKMSVTYYDAAEKEFDLNSVLDDANTFPMFSDEKVIVIQNPYFLSSQGNLDDKSYTALDEYLAQPYALTNLVFYCENTQVDSRKKAFKLLQKYCRNYKIEELEAVEFVKLVRNDIKNNHIQIDNEALDELLMRVPNDIQSWKNELEKLRLFNQQITLDDVRALVSKTLEDDIFTLVNAVLLKDLHKAMRILDDLLTGKRDQVEMVGILAAQFRLMYQCMTLMRGQLSEKEIVSELGVHPYRVKKALEACRQTSISKIHSLLSSLAELDQRVKSGRIDKALGFELFLIEATR